MKENPDSAIIGATIIGSAILLSTILTIRRSGESSSLSNPELLPMASSVPIGAKGKVYVEGRNDMDTTQQMGISWIIGDPDGIIRPEYNYAAWGLWPHTPPGKTHTFDGPTFNLDKAGTWWIAIELFMNPDDPTMVDRYPEVGDLGPLCEVLEEVPPEEVPPEEKKFPWVPVLIGAGALITIAGLAAAKREVK